MENICNTILLHAQEIKNDKQKFIACSAEINGKWYKIKFTKECEGTPKKRGLYDCTINFDDCSIEKGRIYTRNNGETGIANDTIWVTNIVGLRQYTDEELKAMNRLAMGNIFGMN